MGQLWHCGGSRQTNSDFTVPLQTVVALNAPINVKPAGGEAGHRAGI